MNVTKCLTIDMNVTKCLRMNYNMKLQNLKLEENELQFIEHNLF